MAIGDFCRKRQVSVPADTPFGRYSAEFKLVGPDVVPKTIRVNVVVNALLVDVAPTGLTNVPSQSSGEHNFVQLCNRPSTQVLRIANGLGEPMVLDQVQTQWIGPLRDEAGDGLQLIPKTTPVQSADGKSLLIEVLFPPVTHFKSAAWPYTITFVAAAPDLHVETEQLAFRVRYLQRSH